MLKINVFACYVINSCEKSKNYYECSWTGILVMNYTFSKFRTAGSILGTGVTNFLSDWDKISATVRKDIFSLILYYNMRKYSNF